MRRPHVHAGCLDATRRVWRAAAVAVKAWLATSRRGALNGEALAALGASSAQYLAAVLRRHARSETVPPLAPDHAWLIGPFHVALLVLRECAESAGRGAIVGVGRWGVNEYEGSNEKDVVVVVGSGTSRG